MFDPILKIRIDQYQSSQKLTMYTVWSTCTDFSSRVYYNCPKYLPVIVAIGTIHIVLLLAHKKAAPKIIL